MSILKAGADSPGFFYGGSGQLPEMTPC